MNLFIDTAARSPRQALIKSATVLSLAQRPVFVLGDYVDLSITLVDGANGIDSRSGDSGDYRLRLGVGVEGGLPTGGTWKLGFNSSYTAPLSVEATAAQVSTALNAVPTIGTYNATVTGAWPVYQVEFTGSLGGGDRALLSSIATGLTPSGKIAVAELRAGTTGVNELQLVRVMAAPDVETYAFAGSGTAFVGGFDMFGKGLATSLGGLAQTSVTIELELETLADGNRQTIAQIDALVRNEIITE